MAHKSRQRSQKQVGKPATTVMDPKAVVALALKYPDGRERLPRFLADVKERLITDLGKDLSAQKMLLVDRVAHIVALLAIDEHALASRKPIDGTAYASRINTLVALLRTLGMERVAARGQSLRDLMGEVPQS